MSVCGYIANAYVNGACNILAAEHAVLANPRPLERGGCFPRNYINQSKNKSAPANPQEK